MPKAASHDFLRESLSGRHKDHKLFFMMHPRGAKASKRRRHVYDPEMQPRGGRQHQACRYERLLQSPTRILFKLGMQLLPQ